MIYANQILIYEGNWNEDYISEEGELTIIDPYTKEVSLKAKFINGSKIIRETGENNIE